MYFLVHYTLAHILRCICGIKDITSFVAKTFQLEKAMTFLVLLYKLVNLWIRTKCSKLNIGMWPNIKVTVAKVCYKMITANVLTYRMPNFEKKYHFWPLIMSSGTLSCTKNNGYQLTPFVDPLNPMDYPFPKFEFLCWKTLFEKIFEHFLGLKIIKGNIMKKNIWNKNVYI